MNTLPTPGTQIATPRNGYDHHGIYTGNGKVVHYAGLCRRNLHRGPVVETTLADFEAGNGYREIASVDAHYTAAQIIARARTRIGENRYHLLSNNCEHFCTWCIYGQAVSKQVRVFAQRLTMAVATIGLTTSIATIAMVVS